MKKYQLQMKKVLTVAHGPQNKSGDRTRDRRFRYDVSDVFEKLGCS
ncbi:MAG TPA: hypothetical protein VIJ77_00140 [Candidatus Tumulicola sp.]